MVADDPKLEELALELALELAWELVLVKDLVLIHLSQHTRKDFLNQHPDSPLHFLFPSPIIWL